MKNTTQPKRVDYRKLCEVVYQGKVYSYIERTRSFSGEYIYLIETQPGKQQWVNATPALLTQQH